MSKRSEKKARLTAIGLLLLAQCLTQTVQAQTPDQLLRGFLDTVKQIRSRDKLPRFPSEPTSQGVPAMERWI